MNIVQFGTVGIPITLTVVDPSGEVVDISGVDLTNALSLRSPENRLKTKTPAFVTDGTDGQISYDLVAGDIDAVGRWQVQFTYVQGGASVPSGVLAFFVPANIFP